CLLQVQPAPRLGSMVPCRGEPPRPAGGGVALPDMGDLHASESTVLAVPARADRIGRRETHRVPVLRPLDVVAALAGAFGLGRAAAVDRAGGGGRGARR